ncbi:MFS transporter [Catellatospora sp. NEAU-YM18]|nr:MFS transporter [Catellatospora tritici]
MDRIGESDVFFLFTVMCLVTYIFVWKLQPETKGRTLEQIQQMWTAKAAAASTTTTT